MLAYFEVGGGSERSEEVGGGSERSERWKGDISPSKVFKVRLGKLFS